jgi:uncharacterized protein YgiM (DUF1202 family)
MRIQVHFRHWLLLSLLALLGLFFLALAPTHAVAQDRVATGIVTTGALNVRSGPGPEFQLIGTSYQGHAVAILGRSGFNTWVQVRTFAGLVGWMNANYMQLDVPLNNLPVVPGQGGIPAPVAAIGVVNTGAVNVRSGPSHNHSIITIAYQGYTFSLLGRSADNAWANVRMVDGTVGWVNFGALNINVAVNSLPVIAAPAPPTGGATAVVNTGALNVRSGPGVQFSVVSAVYSGHVVQMLGRNADGSWVKARLFNGQEGWVNSRFLNPSTPIANLPIADAPGPVAATGVVNTGALNVRSGPGVGFSALEVIYQGNQVSVLGRVADSSWVQIRTARGTIGWVNTSLLNLNVPPGSLPVVGDTTTVPTNAVVSTGRLNVRSGPALGFPIMTTLTQGTQLTLIGRSATAVTPPWVQVRLSNGLTGWVNANYLFTNVPLNTLPITG